MALMTIVSNALVRFLLLFAALYAAFGAASPFLPAFLQARGLDPDAIGTVLAAATAVRLIAGPAAARLADTLSALRLVLAASAALAAAAALCFLPASGLWLLFVVALAHAAALAPTTTLADALALGAASRRPNGFEYGWVRGAGSAAFVAGSIVAGQAIGLLGISVIVGLEAAFLLAAAGAAMGVPETHGGHEEDAGQGDALPRPDVRALLALPAFRRVAMIATLVLGSHAMHDSFAIIRWEAAGISAATASVLWSESVAAEVLVFCLVGPPLLDRLGPAGAMTLAAVAGIVRWIAMAYTADVAVLAFMQPLHGLTFALLHLAAMRVIARVVPPALAATAQALYGTLAVGASTAVLIFASGFLYGRFGAGGFWAMAVLCALALPLMPGLKQEYGAIRPQ